MAAETLYPVRDVATMWRCSPSSIRRWVQAGEIPVSRDARGWRISESAIAEFLARRTEPAHLP